MQIVVVTSDEYWFTIPFGLGTTSPIRHCAKNRSLVLTWGYPTGVLGYPSLTCHRVVSYIPLYPHPWSLGNWNTVYVLLYRDVPLERWESDL